MACQLKEAVELLLSKPVAKKAFKAALAKTSTSKTPLINMANATWETELRGVLNTLSESRKGTLIQLADKTDKKNSSKKGTGFQGYVGGFNSKGKGTSAGDGKDKAMRKVADGFIGEIGSSKGSRSSSATSLRHWFTTLSGTELDKEISRGVNSWTSINRDMVPMKDSSVIMLARNSEFKGKPISKSTKDNILTEYRAGSTFVVGDMPGVDSQFIDYLEEIGASYKIYHNGDTPRINYTESRKGTSKPQTASEGKSTRGSGKSAPEAAKAQKTIIDSNQKGLEYALTNPTHTSPKGYAWVKGDKVTRDMLSKGITYNGNHYADVEQAFQELKDKNEGRSKPEKSNSGNYRLMVDLITTKLETYNELVSGIDDKGGLRYLNSVVHQPTTSNTVWETGGKDWFKSALIDAYNGVKRTTTGKAEYQVKSKHKIIVGTVSKILDTQKELKVMYPSVQFSLAENMVNEFGAAVVGRALGRAVQVDLDNIGPDTIPHEYAHVYINVLENVPFMSNVLTKIEKTKNLNRDEAKEYLADKMGVHYANDLIIQDSKTIALIKRLWVKILSIFSQAVKDKAVFDDIITEIGRDFKTGKNVDLFEENILASTQSKVNEYINLANSFEEQMAAAQLKANKTGKGVELTDDDGNDVYIEPALINPLEGLYKNSPELAAVGTQAEYLEYLNTIFPDSQVKDVLAHDTGSEWNGKVSFTDSWMFNKDIKIDGMGGNYGLVSGEGFYMYKPNGKQWDDNAATTGLMLVDMKEPLDSSSKEYKDLPGNTYYEKMANLASTDVQSNPDGYYMLDEETRGIVGDPTPVTINSIVKDKTKYDGFINEVRPGLIEYVGWTAEQVHILGSKADITKFKAYKSSNSKLTLAPSKSLLAPVKPPSGLSNDLVSNSGFDIKSEFHLTVLGFPQGKEIAEWLGVNGTKRMEKLQALIDEADFSYTEKPEIYTISRDREALIDWQDASKGTETLHEEAIIQLVNAPGVEAFINKVNSELGFNFPVPFPHISLAVKGTKFGIGIANEKAFKELNPVLLEEEFNEAAKAHKTIIDSNQKELGATTKIVGNIADTLDMYHGTSVDIAKFIDKDGNLVLIPAKNFGGKTQSISFTHSKDTAMRYASQIKGGGPQGFDFSSANVFKIDAGVIENLTQENGEEFAVNTSEPIIIPKGSFKVIPHKLMDRIRSVVGDYSVNDYIKDTYNAYERESLSETDKITEYIYGFIAEEDPELADAIYTEMEYIRSGEYDDLIIPTRDGNGADGDVSVLNFKDSTTAITEYESDLSSLKKTKPERGLGASEEVSGLNEVIISDEEYQVIKESNQYYKDNHPKMFSFGDEYRFHDDTNTITLLDPALDNDVDEQMHEVYTAHEIAHALTWEYLNDPANKDTVTYLKNALKVAKRDFEPGRSLEEHLLADRLTYASTNGYSDIHKVAELVAILSSEPNIRKSFIEAFPQTTRSKLEKILDVIKAFIAKNIGMEDTGDVIATVDAIMKAGKINPIHKTNSTSRGIGAIEALGSANKEADDMYMEMYQPTTVSVNNTRTEEVVDTTPKQKVQMYFNGSKSGEAREVKKVSVKDNMLTLELVKGGTYQFDLDGRVTNGLHTGITPKGSAKVKSIQANLRAILQSIEVPAIMPTQISKEAMLEAKAIIAEANKKCEG